MKSIDEQLTSYQFGRPGLVHTNGHQKNPENNAAMLFNGIFEQLRAAFPASAATYKNQDDVNEVRRQWVIAFVENGITTQAQVETGMKRARKEESPYMPSPGKFVSWCKDSSTVLGITTDDAMAEFRRYNRDKGRYATPEEFNWTKPVMYWLVTEARRAMYQRQLSESEVESFITRKMAEWAKKIAAGEKIPNPVKTIDKPVQVQTEHNPGSSCETRYMPNAAYLGSVTPAMWMQQEYRRRKAAGMIK